MFSRKIVSLFLAALVVTAQTASAQNPNRNRFLVQGTNGKGDKEKEVQNVANGNGGKVKEKHGKKDREFLVVEFPSNANPNAVNSFKNKLARKGYKVEVDEPMYPIPIIEDGNGNNLRRKLADEIPWGISNIFKQGSNSVIPPQSYLPTDVTKPICIVDSGYMINHPDLPNDALNADPDQASGSSTPFDVDRSECSWHGTHVAGTIAAMDNEQGVLGVFPGTPDIKVVRVFSGSNCGYTYTSSVVGAVEKCIASGAKIITMSLGCDGCYSSSADTSYQGFTNDGILLIAAAGNSGNSAYSYPASYSSVMSVGAINSSENIVSFSQYNDQVDIAAPGSSVKSTTGSSGYSFLSGTSMATPHVSGAATLLWNKFPDCTNVEVRNALQNGALDKGVPGKDNYYGHGILRYYNAEAILANDCGRGPTDAPTKAPTSAPCEGNLIDVDIKTDNYASETTWTLTNTCTNEVVLSGGPYQSKNSVQPTASACVQGSGDYEFTINDSFGDGICCSFGSGSYAVSYNGVEALSGGSFTFSETKSFGTGCGGSPPTSSPTGSPTSAPTKTPTVSPTAAPTKTPTDSPTKAPSASPVASPPSGTPPPSACPSGQSLVEVDINLDNYPGETNWSLSTCDGNIVVAGGQYTSQGANVFQSVCVPSDGSYYFRINDTYGDGICCSYGSGSFDVKFKDVTVASGGAFGSSFATAFGSGVQDGKCSITSQCPVGEKLLNVQVNEDYYPNETSWTVNTCDGTTVVSGTTGIVQKCIKNDSYTFTIRDSYGDGICCSYGQGSYEVTLDGAQVAAGGEFGISERTTISGVCPNLGPIFEPADICSEIKNRGRCRRAEECAWKGNAYNGRCVKAPKVIPEKGQQ